MYGLLLENVRCCIIEKYGEKTWIQVRVMADIEHHTFVIHNVYSETLIPRLVKACSDITGTSCDDIMYLVGCRFVSFVGQYGYGRILKVLGRNMRDFLNGLDNLHEYLRFSYPKLSPPSFFVDQETKHGIVLHYRSKRKGYLYYVLGQIVEVGRLFYKSEVNVKVIKEEDIGDRGCSYVIQIKFDNKDFGADGERWKLNRTLKNSLAPSPSPSVSSNSSDESHRALSRCATSDEQALTVPSDVFFDIFPFHVLLDENLNIRSIGSGLKNVLPDVTGSILTDVFEITRPILTFTWSNVLMHTNVVFELLSKCCVQQKGFCENGRSHRKERMHLKGQMMHMRSWNAIIFLGTPILESLETMFNIGLYINDLSMHDSSRDLVLAGMQQSAELRLALDQEKQKSSMLEASMRRLDVEMKRTDALLYRMIPKQVADRLRKGEPALSTCETFEKVTILFSDVVGFTTICSKILPMEVVKMLNEMYTKFDYLCEMNDVYKVETIGDAYMVVSGVPEPTEKHARNVADMALAMIDVMPAIPNPSYDQQHLQIRIGIHSGMVVAGVVGIKMPRYCLFGDTVNTASRMESGGSAMSIHISESTKEALPTDLYRMKQRGTIPIKGKGEMQTYWLLEKLGSIATPCPRENKFPNFVNKRDAYQGRDNSIDTESPSGHNIEPSHNGPLCPFAQIFSEVYAAKEGHNSGVLNLLESPPHVGRSANYTRRWRTATDAHIASVNENYRNRVASFGSGDSGANFKNTIKWSFQSNPVWVERVAKPERVLDSTSDYKELLNYRSQETKERLTKQVEDVVSTDENVKGDSHKSEVKTDIVQGSTGNCLTSGVFQFICFRTKMKTKSEADHEGAANSVPTDNQENREITTHDTRNLDLLEPNGITDFTHGKVKHLSPTDHPCLNNNFSLPEPHMGALREPRIQNTNEASLLPDDVRAVDEKGTLGDDSDIGSKQAGKCCIL